MSDLKADICDFTRLRNSLDQDPILAARGLVQDTLDAVNRLLQAKGSPNQRNGVFLLGDTGEPVVLQGKFQMNTDRDFRFRKREEVPFRFSGQFGFLKIWT